MMNAIQLALLLVTQNTGPVISEFYATRPEDYCNLDGTRPSLPACPETGTGDWAPIFEAMMDDPMCAPTSGSTPANAYRQACTALLQCNFNYRFARPLDMCRGYTFVGCGYSQSWSSTVLTFAANIDGIRMYANPSCPRGTPSQHNGKDMMIKGVAITSENSSTPNCWETSPPAACATIGINAMATPHLEEVKVSNFGRGILISGVAPANANLWTMHRVRSNSNFGRGIEIEGADSNAGLGTLVDSSSNCRRAAKWFQWDTNDVLRTDPPCSGIRDRSFLMNTWVATHVSDNRDTGLRTYSATGVTVTVNTDPGESGSRVTFTGIATGHDIPVGFPIYTTTSGTCGGWSSASDITSGAPLAVTSVAANSITIGEQSENGHAAYTGSGTTGTSCTITINLTTAWYPPIQSNESAASGSTWVGTYQEGGLAGLKNEFENNASVLGGNIYNLTDMQATTWQGRTFGGNIKFENLGSAYDPYLQIGDEISAYNPLFEIGRTDGASSRWYLGYESTYDTWKLCNYAAPNTCPLRLTTSTSGYRLNGMMWLGSTDYLVGPTGGDGVFVVQAHGTGNPASTAPWSTTANYPVGSIYTRIDTPAYGSPSEYRLVCTAPGTASGGNCTGGGTKEWRVSATVAP